tara:strand:- start:144 stop:515 length:372 start_codon:yes stop_codon:yes gene_type:complete
MVKYRKAFRSSIRDALSAEKVRERERKKLWNSSPDRIRKGNQSIKKLNKSDEEREFREKRNQTTTYHSLLSQSLLVRLPHFLALGANRIRVGRAMLHVFCLFFLSKEVFRNNQKVTKLSMMDG